MASDMLGGGGLQDYAGEDRRGRNPFARLVRRLERYSPLVAGCLATLLVVTAAVVCNLIVHLIFRGYFAAFVIWNPALISTIVGLPTFVLLFAVLARVRETRMLLRERVCGEIDQLEHFASLGREVSSVTHEAATPLGVVVTASSALRGRTRKVNAALASGSLQRSELESYLTACTEFAELIERNSISASDLLGALKTVAADQASGKRRQIDVADYIREVLRSLQPTIRAHRHRIEVINEHDVTANLEPGSLSQIISNLVRNALMHGFPDGQAGKIIITVGGDGTSVSIGFRDNGCGISAEHVPHIFEEFYTTRRHDGGTGVGLHIVRRIVERRLGGSISCDSQPGLGTEFLIVFPGSTPFVRAA